MDSTKRIGIILVSSVVFITSTISIGITLGFPFNQTVTILTLVGLAFTFSVSTEQIVRWAGESQTANLTASNSVAKTENGESQLNNSISSVEGSLYTSFEEDKEWQKYHDSGYKFTRVLSMFANQLGRIVYQIPFITKRKVWTGIAFIMFIGLAGLIIALSEQMIQFGFETQLWEDIATTFSIRLIEANPTLAAVLSFFISILPLGYLITKQQMTCESCRAEFSLKSLGRFYNGKWGKESVPITDEEGNQVGKYHEYEGYRILECQECGKQYQIETRWDDRSERL